MCEHGDTVILWVKIPYDLSSTGVPKWRDMPIDRCIAPLVKALQAANIHMRGSCCGHGKGDGSIELQDGRQLIIRQLKDG